MRAPASRTIFIPKTAATHAHRLAYLEWGNPASTPVFCMHGLTRNAHDFDFLAERLAANYRVICPDMAGRGQSEPLPDPAAYHYGTYVSDMLFLIRELGISKAHWIGTSMGGITGMMLANAAPGLLASLALNDIGCVVSAAGLRRIGAYAGWRTQFTSRAEAEALLRENCKPFGIKSEAHWRHLFEHSLFTAPDGTTRLAYDPAIIHHFPKGEAIADIDLWNLWEGMSRIPILLLRGETSDLLSREMARAMQEKHADLTWREIPGAGHAPSLDEPERISLIADWLQRVS